MNVESGGWLRPFLVASLFVGCSGAEGPAAITEAPRHDGRLFTELPSAYTGVRFENRLVESPELNVFLYRNFYNGGGVAVGDLTGDGLPEILLTSNLDANRLYLNEGTFRFRDVTDDAGLAGRRGKWATGVTFVDLDADGWLDVYVCHAGNGDAGSRANELYIHQGLNADGVPTFREMAGAYGIADEGYSTHAAFFDYDRDGDLDLYLVSNSPRPVTSFGSRNRRGERHPFGGDKLYRNDGDRFADVSEQAGIFGSEAAFGLGVAVGDLTRDGWPDVYVSNDFFERDYLYVNQQDGTFADVIEAQMPSISLSSMGLDVADVDNDGWLDLYVIDMLPADDYRVKTTSSFESWDAHQSAVRRGYHHQFMRNMLQLNNGNGTFGEVGQMAGVAATDWSWSALIADFDQDGRKDLYVTNGILRDVTSQDYISFLSRDETIAEAQRGMRVDFQGLIEATTSTPLTNQAFRNEGILAFSEVGTAWGLDTRGFSNGAAYGDLDGDGAPDLVVNNVNAEASIYRNNARSLLDTRYLQILLEGEGANRFAVGARVELRTGDAVLVQELMPSRGFQSSVDYVLTFGLGALDTVESVTVRWPDGRVGTLQNVPANRRLTVRQADATEAQSPGPTSPFPILEDVTDGVPLPFVHRENAFVDFHRHRLVPRLLSTEGPLLALTDIDGDGLDDVFIGGAKDQPGAMLRQGRDGAFVASNEPVFAADRFSEDVGAVFFDANGDGSPDLYVVSGGSEFSDMAPALQDRLYVNDGRGNFRSTPERLPPMGVSGSRAAAGDFDGDGDLDLFVGARLLPWRYGFDPRSVLLENDGRGYFRDVIEQVAPDLVRAGMVTDALWHDVDEDGHPDLVLVGEWMPITVFRNTGAGRLERLAIPGLERSHGWWNRVVAGDFTGDGRTDFVIGNLGLNTRFRASDTEPTTVHISDFDRNGSVEQIVSVSRDGVSHPIVLRDKLFSILPILRERYPDYASYAGQTVADIFTSAEREDAVVKQAYTYASALARNNGDGSFTLEPLPREAQIAPIYGILAADVNADGSLDLLVAGNFDGVEPEIGRMRAGYGMVLLGDGRGGFTPVRGRESGFIVPGQGRDIRKVRTAGGDIYVVARNDDRPLLFRLRSPTPVSAARAVR